MRIKNSCRVRFCWLDMLYMNVTRMDLFYVALRGRLLDESRSILGTGKPLVAMMIRNKALAFFIFWCWFGHLLVISDDVMEM